MAAVLFPKAKGEIDYAAIQQILSTINIDELKELNKLIIDEQQRKAISEMLENDQRQIG
jgi:ribosomal protein L12E/L44/L45/RPP1/RPP2